MLDDDLAHMLMADFGTPATVHPNSPKARGVVGIFGNHHQEIEGNTVIATAQPSLLVRTRDAEGVRQGSGVILSTGAAYVVEHVEDDGTGLTTLILLRA